MASSWVIAIEKDGEFLFADKYNGTSEYIPALCRVARLVDEKIPEASVKVGSFASRGVIGLGSEWEREERYWTVEPSIVKTLADAARNVRLNYE